MKVSLFLLGVASFVPSVASAEMLAVKTDSASFRAEPSDKAAIVYAADKFYPVEVLDRKSGWAKVKDFEGETAWVAERALGKLDTIVIDSPTANIRQKAATDAQVVFKVAHGEVFKVEDHKADWLKVKDAHGDGGWIRLDKTWGLANEKGKTQLDKNDALGADEDKANAKTSHEDKGVKIEASSKNGEVELICKTAVEEKVEPKIVNADLVKPEKHEKLAVKPAGKPHGKPLAHNEKNPKVAHVKGHVKKTAHKQKKPIRRRKK